MFVLLSVLETKMATLFIGDAFKMYGQDHGHIVECTIDRFDYKAKVNNKKL